MGKGGRNRKKQPSQDYNALNNNPSIPGLSQTNPAQELRSPARKNDEKCFNKKKNESMNKRKPLLYTTP
jgi:hypothetical protein